MYWLNMESDTYRISKQNGTILFIDPPGGPMISRGFIIDKTKQVKDILYSSDDKYFVIKTEKIIK